MPEKVKKRRYSFQLQIMIVFWLISIVPLIVIGGWAYQNARNTTFTNMRENSELMMKQADMAVDQLFDDYRQLVNRICIDETVVHLIHELNEGKQAGLNRVLMREALRDYAGENQTIHSITVITGNQQAAFYDVIASGADENSWLQMLNLPTDRLYEEIAGSEGSVYYPTTYVTTFGNQPYYLFHVGMPAPDYQNIDKISAVILISVRQEVLWNLCSQQAEEKAGQGACIFVVDKEGDMLFCERSDLCDAHVSDIQNTKAAREKDYKDFAQEQGLTGDIVPSVYTYCDEEKGWTYVSILNQKPMLQKVREQWGKLVMLVISFSLILYYVILRVSKSMTRSIRQVTDVMKQVEEGKYIQIPSNPKRSMEIETIASQFNSMIEKLQESAKKEKEAVLRQKDAEIVALETQINPHFLYNVLDTVNWKAIDKDEYEISNMINSLAHILRYGIDKSNRVVTIREEMRWMEQYLYLQQTRLRNSFSGKMDVEEKAQEFQIYKLLFQPFIENAVLHGFKGVDRPHILLIQITLEEEKLKVVIADNGKGMSEAVVRKMLEESSEKTNERDQIGISNALNRLRLYYGEDARIQMESKLEEGTRITIWIPPIL